MISRRGFLKGILAAAMAPAICKAENLMKISVPKGFSETDAGLYIPKPSVFETDMTGDFTLETWVKPVDLWQSVAIVRNSGNLKTFIDGEEVTQDILDKNFNGLRLKFNNGQLTADSGKFEGLIDELKITTIIKGINPNFTHKSNFEYIKIPKDF